FAAGGAGAVDSLGGPRNGGVARGPAPVDRSTARIFRSVSRAGPPHVSDDHARVCPHPNGTLGVSLLVSATPAQLAGAGKPGLRAGGGICELLVPAGGAAGVVPAGVTPLACICRLRLRAHFALCEREAASGK